MTTLSPQVELPTSSFPPFCLPVQSSMIAFMVVWLPFLCPGFLKERFYFICLIL